MDHPHDVVVSLVDGGLLGKGRGVLAAKSREGGVQGHEGPVHVARPARQVREFPLPGKRALYSWAKKKFVPFEGTYRMTHHVDPNFLLISKQRPMY